MPCCTCNSVFWFNFLSSDLWLCFRSLTSHLPWDLCLKLLLLFWAFLLGHNPHSATEAMFSTYSSDQESHRVCPILTKPILFVIKKIMLPRSHFVHVVKWQDLTRKCLCIHHFINSCFFFFYFVVKMIIFCIESFVKSYEIYWNSRNTQAREENFGVSFH